MTRTGFKVVDYYLFKVAGKSTREKVRNSLLPTSAALAVGVANGKTGGPRRSQAGAAGLSALGHAGRRAAPPSADCTVLYSPTPP